MGMRKPEKPERMKPLSLYPMSPEEAIRKALSAPPLNGQLNGAVHSKRRKLRVKKKKT